MGMSLKPSEMKHGTGLINDVDVTVREARWVSWDYQGKIQTPVLAMGITFVTDDGEEHDQYFSAGNDALKSFVPSKDGKTTVAVKEGGGLNDNSTLALFMVSLVEAGFPEDKLGDDATALEGLYCHIVRKPQPKREGIAKQEGQREQTYIAVEKIHSLPWEKKVSKPGGVAAKKSVVGKPAAAAAAGKTNGAAAPTDDSELDAKAMGAVMDAAMGNGGSIAKSGLSQAIFKALVKDPDRNKVVTLAFKDEFLAAEGRPWTYDGTTVAVGE